MALVQTRLFSVLQKFQTTRPLVGLDIRYGACLTQVRHHQPPPRFRHPLWWLRKERSNHPQYLTSETRDFIKEVIAEKFGPPAVIAGVQTHDSPLKNVTKIEPVPWYPGIRRTSTIARKIGIYPLWTKDGRRVQTTLLQISDNHVIRYNPPGTFRAHRRREKIIEKKNLNKYGALVVGAESADPQNFTKEYCGLFKGSGLPPKKVLTRFLVSPAAVLPVGTPLTVMHYKVGDRVDVTGFSIQRGFQGVMKRWNFKGMSNTHGVTKTHRRGGNIGGGGAKGRVWPGKKMPGHMGGRTRVARGLRILRINTEYNVMWVSGRAIPGLTNSVVYIHDTLIASRRAHEEKTAPPVPTYIPKESDKELPRDIWAEDMHPFGDPSVTFQIVDSPTVKTGAKLAKISRKK